MNKPEKKEEKNYSFLNQPTQSSAWDRGYNQACDEWEKYTEADFCRGCVKRLTLDKLPTEEEIWNILRNYKGDKTSNSLAKAIHGRIHGKDTT